MKVFLQILWIENLWKKILLYLNCFRTNPKTRKLESDCKRIKNKLFFSSSGNDGLLHYSNQKHWHKCTRHAEHVCKTCPNLFKCTKKENWMYAKNVCATCPTGILIMYWGRYSVPRTKNNLLVGIEAKPYDHFN